jgi:DNA polymerase-3 subunit gamma/tau
MDALTRIMEVLSDCEMRLRDAASKKILIEVALLKAIEALQAVSLDTVLQQLQNLRGGEGASVPAGAPAVTPARAVPVAKPQESAHSAPKAPAKVEAAPALMESAPAAAPGDGGGLSPLWSKLLEAVGRASPFAKTYLLEAHPVSFARNLFTIGFDPEFEDHISLVDNARNHAMLQTKLSELGHPNTQFKFIKAERPADWAAQTLAVEPATPTTPAPAATKPAKAASSEPKEKAAPVSTAFSKDDFKDDPLIKQALEIFKGQIVEVRK